MNGNPDGDWVPPQTTDADRRRAEAERRRTDLITKKMGEYLLQGYRMLADVCEQCQTILMQDRQKQVICISCSELDSEVPKESFASSEKEEKQQQQQQLQQTAYVPLPVSIDTPLVQVDTTTKSQPISSAIQAVTDSLCRSTVQLSSPNVSIATSQQLVNLIRSCAETLEVLKRCSD